MERVLLLHRKSHKHDAVRFPLFTIFVATIIYLLVDGLLASPHWVVFNAFLKYGFSGDGLWFVGWWIIVALLALFFYGIAAKGAQVEKDEFLYLEGDELVYSHGRIKERVKAKEVYEILIIGGGPVERKIRLKTRNPRQEILFGGDYSLSLRSWISMENLISKGMEIYKILRKINPDIELKRVVERKYRVNKNAIMERYENGKWVPERIKPWWEGGGY